MHDEEMVKTPPLLLFMSCMSRLKIILAAIKKIFAFLLKFTDYCIVILYLYPFPVRPPLPKSSKHRLGQQCKLGKNIGR